MARQTPEYQRLAAVTCVVIGGINSGSMHFDALAQYGLPGAALAVAGWLIYALIRRGFRVVFRAEVPRRRPE
jgi:membrane protease YdiL (CAAX protease family)